jgi:hypothetical protein
VRDRLAQPEVRDRIYRILSLAALLVAVGACVVLLLAFVMKLEVLLVAFAGVVAVSVSFYLFIRLWPRDVEPPSSVGQTLEKAMEKPPPKRLSPEEHRRQREQAQKLIREKAAPALAKAIRGILRQSEMEERKKRR